MNNELRIYILSGDDVDDATIIHVKINTAPEKRGERRITVIASAFTVAFVADFLFFLSLVLL